MANRRVLDVGTSLNRTHHHFACIYPDPNPQWSLPLGSHPVAVAPHLFLHSQCGVERALRMVLMPTGAPNNAKMPSPVDCTR
jgi:hypothetical protein